MNIFKQPKVVERKLNLDIPGSVSEFEMLIKRVLPKNILFQIIYGKGLEFDGYRDFTQDDDSGRIDWKATVRAQRTLVRKFIEERDLKILFLIDVSDSMIFGSTEKLKCEYAAELSAALSHLILNSGDRVGFVLFNDKVVHFRAPGLGEKQFNIFSHEISNPLNYGGKFDLNNVLENVLGRMDRSTSMVFVISDFLKFDEKNNENLKSLASLFETIAIVVRDPLDKTLPDINKEIVIESSSTGEKLIVNPKIARHNYELNSLEQMNVVKKFFQDSGIDFSEFMTDSHFALNLAEFLKERAKKRTYKKQDGH